MTTLSAMSRFNARSRRWLNGLAVSCLLGLALPDLAVGQSEPAELQALRKDYLSRVASANRALTEQYLAALQRHERELGLSGNYEEALRAAERIAQLKREQEILPSDSIDDRITLRARDARLASGVTFDPMENMLTNWRNPGASATWSILRMEPGEYEIRLTYSVGRTETSMERSRLGEVFPRVTSYGGTFVFRDINTLRPDEETQIEFSISSTGGWNSYETTTIDTIEFTRSSANVRIESIRPREGQVANIRSVELVPLGKAEQSAPSDAESSAQPDAVEPQELVQLRDSHRQRIEQAAAPQVSSYLRILQQLQQRYEASDRENEAEAVKRGAQQSLSRVGLPPVSSSTDTSSGRHLLPGGFEVLHGAELVSHPENRVDCFHVRHNDETFKVRLYFVTGPEPEPASREDNAEIASYFGIGPEQAATLADVGMRFLSHCLGHHEFTMVTQWVPDEEGCYYVRVMLAGLGSLERTLVSRGFVAIKGRTINSPRMPAQAYVDSILREAERSARENDRGGWGMN